MFVMRNAKYWPQLPGLCPDLEGSGRSPLKGELSIDGFVADMAPVGRTPHFLAHVVGSCSETWFASIWQSITRAS